MKIKSFLSLSLAALVAASPLQHIVGSGRQSLTSLATLGRRQALPGGKPLGFVDEKPMEVTVKNKGAKRVFQRFGPVTLKGRGSAADSGQQDLRFSLPKGLCRSCTVLKGHIGLGNLDGTPAIPQNGSGVYIHHILTSDFTKRAPSFITSCMGGGLLPGAKFVGSGEDNNNVAVWYTNKDGSHNGGFHIGANDNFGMEADIVSLNVRESQIYITMDLEYVPGIVGSDTRETLLTVETCGGQRLSPSTSGPTKSKSGSFRFTDSGNIIVAKGHLHAGGDKVQIYINEKLVCESKAVYNDAKGGGAISEMTLCPIIPVKTGDRLYFTAVYDASKHPLRHETHGMGGGMPDVMGMLDIVFSK